MSEELVEERELVRESEPVGNAYLDEYGGEVVLRSKEPTEVVTEPLNGRLMEIYLFLGDAPIDFLAVYDRFQNNKILSVEGVFGDSFYSPRDHVQFNNGNNILNVTREFVFNNDSIRMVIDGGAGDKVSWLIRMRKD